MSGANDADVVIDPQVDVVVWLPRKEICGFDPSCPREYHGRFHESRIYPRL